MKTFRSTLLKTCTFCVCLLLMWSCKKQAPPYQATAATHSKTLTPLFIQHIDSCLSNLNRIITAPTSLEKQDAYSNSRRHFKYLEPILAYADKNNFKTLNAPNIIMVKGEESFDTKIVSPFGFQVIEETLFTTPIDTVALVKTTKKTYSRLKLIQKNTSLHLKPHHIIWLLRDEIVRIATTGITGFDSPVRQLSLLESTYAYETLIGILQLNAFRFKSKALLEHTISAFSKSQNALHHDFNTFNRYDFIKKHTHPQLELLVTIQEDWGVTFPFQMALSNTLNSLFTPTALNVNYFTDYNSDTLQLSKKVAFGKALFNDSSLSKKQDMACASCHIKNLAFTDGKKTFNAKQTRNSPTLTYSAYQHSYFMDARTGSLEGQVIGVVNNHNEFDMSMEAIVKRVLGNNTYRSNLKQLYNNKRMDYNIRHAIASYIRTLNTFNSKFDKNIRNENHNLTPQEERGFNLFMGKALCATCHFAPIFNGTVPPDFKDTELEAIGVPQTTDTIHPALSKDLGRYNVYQTTARKHFFKTPTLRNIALTAPYMHNGVYNTLEEVIAFYNKGGGIGLGLDVPHQTLPFDNLKLSVDEQKALVAFLHTLTDEQTAP